jgi:hypothetical protein
LKAAHLLLAVTLFTPRLAASAQDRGTAQSPALELDEFRLSSPPAMNLLGISPSSVTRPNTPRALITSLVSATGSSGIVPDGYALESAPYWLGRHPTLTLDEYYDASLADRLRYFTAISVATDRAKATDDVPEPDARVSIAARTLLFNGHPSPALRATSTAMRKSQLDYITAYRQWEKLKPHADSLSTYRNRLAAEEDRLSSLVTRVLVGPATELRDSTLRTLARRDSARSGVAAAEKANAQLTTIETRLDAIDEKLTSLAKKYSKEDAEADGFIVELAVGTRATFTEGKWGEAHSDGVGIWATPMYRMAKDHLELIAVGRYLAHVAEYEDRNILDAGGALGFDAGKASLSAELTNRTVLSRDGKSQQNSARWAALFNYPLPAKLHLVAAFGTDFRKPDGTHPVIATLGLNLGLGAIMISP